MTTSQAKKPVKNNRWVFTFPVRVSGKNAHRAFFLLSTRQVVTVLDTVPIWPLPFHSPTNAGIGLWNDELLPVVNLESHLGFKGADTAQAQRLLVVHALSRHPDHSGSLKALICVDRHMQNIPLPEECEPVSSIPWIPDTRAVRGVYNWNQRHLIVMDLAGIINGHHGAPA